MLGLQLRPDQQGGRPSSVGIWQRWRTSPSGRVGLDVLNHFNDDDGWAMASHVSLTTLMSIFPFLIFVAALAGFIGDIKLADILTDFLFSSWPRTIADPIVSEVHRAVANASGGLITGSALVAFCLASAGVGAVRSALNRAYRAAEQRAFLHSPTSKPIVRDLGCSWWGWHWRSCLSSGRGSYPR